MRLFHRQLFSTAPKAGVVALCGTATRFFLLMLIRIGVAIGEAGTVPPSNSLIADYFARAERPRATGIFMMGASLATILGYFFGGWLIQLYGWRTAFMLIGAPGIATGLHVWLTLKEPQSNLKSTNSQVDTPNLIRRAIISDQFQKIRS